MKRENIGGNRILQIIANRPRQGGVVVDSYVQHQQRQSEIIANRPRKGGVAVVNWTRKSTNKDGSAQVGCGYITPTTYCAKAPLPYPDSAIRSACSHPWNNTATVGELGHIGCLILSPSFRRLGTESQRP
ncbi:uncharacterized protein MELLADRAFT_101382 [Melampsora larici-populina 98AG31]|uniref:Uncharacterized protein n=1 Tax=Melampsora larici-populina (strain 98AG31 / pathotype 3-4-7) TaxID=747676 RepID=F4R4K0_MELLP|nr:uncharacterized protein MELLADRAFT_101382 [Melampsora larici-populina 98AG31]EGG12987.1 hypothetical protein MELLADRAFT_101382 [Melampsora larici-populina 98AG31]